MLSSMEFSDMCIPAMAALIFAVYTATLSPSIAGGDSGELVAEGCALGTAHPPGYPLFTMMVHLLKRIADPLQVEVAYAVNISSAVLTTGAAFLMGKIVATSGNKHITIPGALLSMGMFAFSPLIWQYAVTAEVFPLNTFFMALLVYLVVRFQQDRSEDIVCAGALLCGVALCNQHTAVLYEVPLVLWILTLHRDEIRARPVLIARYSVLFLAGIALYGYLPLAASVVDSPGGWGDVKSIGGIIHHILRRDYGTFQLYSGRAGKQTESMIERSVAYLEDLYSTQGMCIAPLLALTGALYWIKSSGRSEVIRVPEAVGKKDINANKNRVAKSATVVDLGVYTPAAVAATQLFYFLVFHSLSNLPLSDKLLYGIHQRFWMQPNVVTFMWVGIGFNFLVSIFLRAASSKHFVNSLLCSVGIKKPTKDMEKFVTADEFNSTARIFYAISFLVAFILVAAQVFQFYSVSNQHDNMFFHEYAKALVEPLPPNAVLLVNYDMQWTAIRYMQKCFGLRPDVTAINLSMMTFAWFKKNHHHYPNLVFPGAYYSATSTTLTADAEKPFSMFQFLEANSNSVYKQNNSMGGIYLCGKLSFPDKRVSEAYEVVPFGLTQTFIRRDSGHSLLVPSFFREKNHLAWKTVTKALAQLPDKVKFDEHTWEWTIGRDFADRVVDVAAFLLEQSIPLAANDSVPLMDSAYWLEVAVRLERSFSHGPGASPSPSTALLKNAGLAHAHLVQSKTVMEGEHVGEFALPTSYDIFPNSILPESVDWPINSKGKEWCANQFVQHWGQFLQRDDAKSDPQFKTILQMYEAATKSGKSSAKGSFGKSKQTEKQTKKKKK